jgi:two-component system chemotaxis sensor kinase CheA
VFETLTHLIRNAVDHGIETDRGTKPARATVQVRVERLPHGYQIAVHDDGRGIDVDRVVEKALASALTTPAAVEAMSPSERLALVLRDGVSTADDVTDLSGRGVGASAVATIVEQLGGQLEITSSPGLGTTFSITLPDGEGDEVMAQMSL